MKCLCVSVFLFIYAHYLSQNGPPTERNPLLLLILGTKNGKIIGSLESQDRKWMSNIFSDKYDYNISKMLVIWINRKRSVYLRETVCLFIRLNVLSAIFHFITCLWGFILYAVCFYFVYFHCNIQLKGESN